MGFYALIGCLFYRWSYNIAKIYFLSDKVDYKIYRETVEVWFQMTIAYVLLKIVILYTHNNNFINKYIYYDGQSHANNHLHCISFSLKDLINSTQIYPTNLIRSLSVKISWHISSANRHSPSQAVASMLQIQRNLKTSMFSSGFFLY